VSPDITFVCWGNICRSPMAEVIAREHAEREGLHGVTFSSAGVSAEEAGHPIDPRAAATLTAAGYHPGPFTAHRITEEEAKSAAMLIGMEELHLDKLRALVPQAHNLLSDFDRNAVPGTPIEDPWYGDDSDFETTLSEIEAAIPEVLRRARELVAG
jgi:protein-tyrosine phosphatase